MEKQIVILGAGGDALVIAEAIRQARDSGQPIIFKGFLDDALAGETISGYPVFGRLNDWHLLGYSIQFIPAIQKAKDMPRRASRVESLGIPLERWGRVLHPTAVVAQGVDLGVGVYIAACATLQPGCKIGDFATLRAGVALGHDAAVERFGYVGPNATLCGNALVREGAHVGPNAVVLDSKQVGRFAVVGIGAAVTKDVSEFSIVMGNPARRIGRVQGFGAFVPNQ